MSVLGPGTRVTGRVQGRGGVAVAGRVKGDIRVSGPCQVAAGAVVEGDVAAESLDVAGTVTGDATATGAATIRSTAIVRGAWRAARIAIEPGADVSLTLDAEFDLDLSPKRRSR
ncbi:MAG TPA: polymer-forming cytoskeletal protein [Polyangiaceae bacterium]|nr:polymer-forming cytoskeletal protein [Polyangiaceae bacterium]